MSNSVLENIIEMIEWFNYLIVSKPLLRKKTRFLITLYGMNENFKRFIQVEKCILRGGIMHEPKIVNNSSEKTLEENDE